MRGLGNGLFAWAIGALVLTACHTPETLEIVLVHDPRLDLARDTTAVRLRIADLGDIAVAGDEELVLEREAPSMDALARSLEAAEIDRMVPGGSYVAVVSLAAGAGACVEATQLVGRSLVFTHRDGGYPIPIQIGCANELGPTRGQPIHARLGHAVAATFEGHAIVLGGASVSALTAANPFDYRDVVLDVERYDIATGRFDVVSSLDEGVVWPAAVTLASGEVAMIGGTHPAPNVADVTCEEGQRIVWPATGEPRPLDTMRCLPAAARLETNEVFVIGGAPGLLATSELWDAEMTSVVARADPASNAQRYLPALLPAGDAAFLAFGDGGGSHVEISSPRCTLDGGACYAEIPFEPVDDPGAGWYEGGMALVACVERDMVETGAVYLFGGAIHAGAGAPATGMVDGIYCAQFSAIGATFRRVGTLPTPRAAFRTVPVAGVAGRHLIVGGLDLVTGSEAPGAVLLDLNGCTCGVGAMRSIVVPDAEPLYLHTATTLADDSILVLGGIDLDVTTGLGAAARQAFVLVPDIEAD